MIGRLSEELKHQIPSGAANHNEVLCVNELVHMLSCEVIGLVNNEEVEKIAGIVKKIITPAKGSIINILEWPDKYQLQFYLDETSQGKLKPIMEEYKIIQDVKLEVLYFLRTVKQSTMVVNFRGNGITATITFETEIMSSDNNMEIGQKIDEFLPEGFSVEIENMTVVCIKYSKPMSVEEIALLFILQDFDDLF